MTPIQTVAALVARVAALYQLDVPEIVDAATASKAADALAFEAQYSEAVRLVAHAARRISWGDTYNADALSYAGLATEALGAP